MQTRFGLMTIASLIFFAASCGVDLPQTQPSSTQSSSVPMSSHPSSTQGSTTSALRTSTTTTIGQGPASTAPRAPSCTAPLRVRVPCPLQDGQHGQVQATGLAPLTRVQFGLCIPTAVPTPDDCSPGVIHQTAVGPSGTLDTWLTFDRFLLIGDAIVDCAAADCELRVAIGDIDTGDEARQLLREPLAFASILGRLISTDSVNEFVHQQSYVIELTGISSTDAASVELHQCTRFATAFSYGSSYEHCVGVAASAFARVGDRLRATMRPSRWAYQPTQVTTMTTLRPLDCALQRTPCYLRARVIGEPGTIRSPLRVGGDAATPVSTASKSDGLTDNESIMLTLEHFPPRQWATVRLCLDSERLSTVRPADGDGITGCIVISPLLQTGATPSWPPDHESVTLTVPRYIPWYSDTHDCADPRGCQLLVVSGSRGDAAYVSLVPIRFAP